MEVLERGVEGCEGGEMRGEALAPALFSWAKRRRDMAVAGASKHEVTRFCPSGCHRSRAGNLPPQPHDATRVG